MTILQTAIDACVNLISRFGDREIAFEVAFGIIALAVMGAAATWALHLRFTSGLRRATRTLAGFARDERLSAADRINKAAEALGSGRLKSLWTPYRRSIRPDLEHEGKYTNLVDPHDWFALERLPGRGYEKWAATLAGVFLTVGLLFTFIGLSAALFKVGEAGTDAVRLRDAINEILKISSAKFITSIAGIVAYIGWTILARACASGQSKAAHGLASGIQRLTTFATPETLLYIQTKEAQSQVDRLKTFADDVATAFDQKMGARFEALEPTLKATVRPVVEAIQGVGQSIGEGNQSAITGMIDGLMSEVRGAAGTEMQSLVDAMKETAGELRAAKSGIGDTGSQFSQQLVAAAENMSTAAARVAATMEGRAAEIDARMHRIDEALSSGAASLGGMGAQMSEALEAGLRRALDAMADATASSAGAARSHVEAQLAPLLGTLQELVAGIRQSASDSRGELVEGGRAARQELAAAIGQVGADLARASAEAGAQLTGAFQQATSDAIATMETSLSGFRGVSHELAQRMGQVERSLAAVEQSVRAQVGHLDGVGNTILTAGRTFGTASDELRRAAAPVTSALSAVEGSANSAREALTSVVSTTGAMQTAASAIGAASETARDAFKSYEQRFGTVDDALGRTVARMRDGITELSKQFGEVVREQDEHLAGAVGRLGTGVEELRDAISDLSDTCGLIRQSPKAAVGAR